MMNLTSKSIIREILEKYKIYPSKRLGQNFLIDKGAVREFIEACNLDSEDVVLEVGPGIGTLTQEIAKKVKKVIAVEKDLNMVEILKELLDCWNVKSVRIVEGDILKIPNSRLRTLDSYKLVGNLPFHLTAPVIRKFLESDYPPKEIVFIVQKEVAQRICAKPGDMSILSVSVQFYAKPEIISFISKKSFWPSPKVHSAIIRIVPLINADKKLINADLFFRIVKAGFSQPRKQIINNLSQKLKMDKGKVRNWLLENGVQPSQRAETLNVKDWINLSKTIK